MAANYLSVLRKSYFSKFIFCSLLSNLVTFGEPMQEMVLSHIASKKSTVFIGNASVYGLQEKEPHNIPPDSIVQSMQSLPEVSRIYHPDKMSSTFYAMEEQAMVGTDPLSGVENPYDNFFTVRLPENLDLINYEAVMAYDLYGVSGAEQTTKRINSHPAYGGLIVRLTSQWASVSEILPSGYLKTGANEIFFNRRADEMYSYEVKNLRIEFRERTKQDIAVPNAATVNDDGSLNFIAPVLNLEVTEVEILGEMVPVHEGMLEKTFTDTPKELTNLTVAYETGTGARHVNVPVIYSTVSPQFSFIEPVVAGKTVTFEAKDFNTARYDSLTVSVDREKAVSNSHLIISGLQFKDLKATSEDVENVTAGKYQGYRVQKVNLPDSLGTTLRIKYDPEKIPNGYTAQDVRTFYYDVAQRIWNVLPIDSLDVLKHEVVVTAYGNDTDYINGVIKVPGSPETSSFAPTAMSDIKLADPGAGVVGIAPPSPNHTGSAGTSFALKLPAGRNGMQPSLQVSYNSEAGNGWMGIGWNLATPAISLNTKWGVPLFDDANESEMYSLNGEDLVLYHNGEYTTPNRTASITRGPADRQFYPRKEGSYNKIIRKGSSPANYYWIVTDKMGNKSYYGGYNSLDNGCVMRTGGLTSGNIAHWALKRTEDTYGNYVEYIYDKGTEVVNGVTAQYFYISQINYALKGITNTNFYRVKFLRNTTRTDKTTNARSGCIQVVNALLSEVRVDFVNNGTENRIRKYVFTYYGAQDAAVFSNPFKKSVLKSISEYDTAGNLFYSHSMEYYDDVGTGAIINSGTATWTGEEDTVSPLGVLSGIVLGTEGSALGTSTSVGGTGGFRVGFGLGFNVLSTGATIGGSASYSYNENNTQVSFLDINGDGLPDKVYKNGSTVRYRPNLGLTSGTAGQFGNYINISGISSLGKTTSNTLSYGGDLNLVVVGVGTSGSDSWSQSDHYFNDFNGDGLPDMVTDGQIRFNTSSGTDPNYRSFTTNAAQTENTISPGQMSTQILATMDLPTEEELRASYPQFDHVKVWEAPYTGTVQISGIAYITQLTCESSNTFRFTVEWKHMVSGQWVTTVLGTPTESSASSLTIPSLTQLVNKGDLLFFRVHNKQYGCGGKIRWNPAITYQTAQTVLYYNGPDENGKNVSSFNYANEYMVNNGGTTDVGGAAVNISFDFNLIASTLTALNLSDAVRFTVQRIRYNVQDSDIAPLITTYQRVFTPGSGLSGNGGSNTMPISMNSSPLGTNQRDVLYCYVDSDSNVDWAALKWKPKYTITGSNEIKYPGVTYIPFNENVAQKKYWILPGSLPTPVIDAGNPADNNTNFMVMSHDFNQINWQSYLDLSNTANSSVVRRKVSWVVKKRYSTNVTVLHKKTFYLNKSGITYTISRNADGTSVLNPGDADYNTFFSFNLSKLTVKTIKDQTATLYSAFYIDNTLIGGEPNNYNPATIVLALHPTMVGNPLYQGFTPISLPSPFLAQNSQFYGYGYRGWGQFLYNGGINSQDQSDYGLQPIEATLLDGQAQGDTAQTADQAGSNTTPDDVAGMSSGMTVRYTLYQQSNGNNLYTAPAIKYRTSQGDVDVTFGPDSTNNLIATMGRFGIADIYSQYVDVNNLDTGSGGTFVGLKQYSESHGGAVSANGGIPELSAAGTFSHAQSKLNNQYLDFNGDRYPDFVTPGAIQFTGMHGGFTPVQLTSGIHSSGSRSEETTLGATISGLFPNSTTGDNGVRVYDGTNTQANSGINDTDGKTKNANLWVDVNGDGLPDKVYLDTDGSRVGVNLNTGYGFSAQETNWITNLGGMDISSNYGGSASLAGGTTFPTTSFAIGLGAAKSTSNAETLFIDVNGDGLPDLVRRNTGSYKYYLNTGTSFSSTAMTFYNSDIADQDHSISGNLFGSYTWGFAIPVPFIGAIKTTFTPTLSATAGYSEKRHTLQDIDGDGFVDVLHQGGSSNGNVNANLNKVGKTYLLKRVHTALGGSWTINYSRNGNTYDLPQSKWVLSSIETHDGFTTDSSNNYGPSTSKALVTYANPKHNRREREFLGYGSVTVQEIDVTSGSQSVYRTVVTSYHNENYYLSGAQKSRVLYDSSLQVLSEENTLYNLLNPDTPQVNPNAAAESHFLQMSLIPSAATLLDKSRLFVAVANVTSTSYEGSQSLTTQKHFLSYDGYGNLKEYRDDGEGAEDAYKTVIEYHPATQYMPYGPGFPKKISVYKNAGNVLMREREATYNTGTGGLYEIKTKLNTNAEYSTVQFVYDIFGNITEVHDLENKHTVATNHYIKTITYETTLNMFPASIGNSFGDISVVEQYNYLFGVPVLVKDVNSQYMRTRVDNRGRVIEVTGPNEMEVEATNGGSAWTIRMEYENEAMLGTIPANIFMVNAAGSFVAMAPGSALPTTKKHYALTRHFDPEYTTGTGLTSTNHLLTVSLADGFGQPIQVKKTHQTGSTMKWMVSGFEKKDAFGRVLQNYLPIVETGYPTNPTAAISPTSTIYNYNAGTGIQPFTIMTYDAKDRVKTVKQVGLNVLPGETDTATMEYAIEDGMYVQKLTNERGQTLDTYTDNRGRNRKTVQNQELTTTFHYNATNELLKVVDNENFETEYIYDLAGRKVEMRHPDRGVVTFKYDKASRMTEQSNSNLMPNNQKITYFYDCNRLVRVEYPQNPQNQVKYTYGSNSSQLAVTERAVGRLLVQEDATGMQLFSYGRMGEMIKHLRSVAVANYQSYWFFTQWKYDSWNRVQEIIYPDQEVVSYAYNKAMALQGMDSQMAGIAGGAAQPIISAITYNDHGERASITHGSGTTATTTTYGYDVRRRMNSLTHSFPNTYSVSKGYTYDALSNITDIVTNNPANSLPAPGKIGGPIEHHYGYDNYNRLEHADGVYTGANDLTTPYLRTTYSLDMEYNTDHTIKKKTQRQQQGYVNAFADTQINDVRPVKKTSYVLDYGGYGDAALTTGNYGYQQPHAPRAITEGPGWTSPAADDPRIKQKQILYDANGNQTEIREVLGGVETSLRKNLWDEENRLKAVNLKPDDPTTHPIAIYTYDAAGERTVRYNYDRIDVSSNATEVGQAWKDNVMIYPSGLIMGKPARLRKDGTALNNTLVYTKHYYIGSERVSAKTGTLTKIGDYPETLLSSKMPQLASQAATLIRTPSTNTQAEARQTVLNLHMALLGALPQPTIPTAQQEPSMAYGTHEQSLLNIYYHHPDHLGSSSYITNGAGVVCQHMEYLPFGETLVDEHLNSNNSPFKFNGKEFDEETGNYYYGARYYDPKLSIFISVDPLAEKTMDAYGYCYQNPINLVDPTGMLADDPPVTAMDTPDGTVHEDDTGKWIFDQAANIWRGQNGAQDFSNTIGLAEMTITNIEPEKKETYWLDGYFNPAYDTSQPNPYSPSTDSRVALALCLLPAAVVAIEYFGVQAVGNYLLEEAGEAAFEAATGIPVIIDPVDIVEQGVKKAAKEGLVHGNSLKSPKPTWGYKLHLEDGTFLKNGITSKPIPENRYTKSFMADKFMETRLFPNRLDAATWERAENLTTPGPLNFERYIKR